MRSKEHSSSQTGALASSHHHLLVNWAVGRLRGAGQLAAVRQEARRCDRLGTDTQVVTDAGDPRCDPRM